MENHKGKEAHKGKCTLCDAENIELKKSHFIPKFVYDWLKSTSKTDYIRGSDDVNARLQDGPKDYLLCGKCEGELSTMEKEVADNLFKKLANYRSQPSTIIITESMRVGILSIFWRALLIMRNKENNRTEEDNAAYDSLLFSLKNQINNKKCNTIIYFTPFIKTPPYYGLPSEYTYNLERSVGGQDIRFYDEPHRFFATFKLPFVYFYIFSSGWEESEIKKSTELNEGEITLDSIIDIPDTLRNYIKHMHEQFEQARTQMSQKNLDKIEKDMKKNTKITGSDKSMSRMIGPDIQKQNSSEKEK